MNATPSRTNTAPDQPEDPAQPAALAVGAVMQAIVLMLADRRVQAELRSILRELLSIAVELTIVLAVRLGPVAMARIVAGTWRGKRLGEMLRDALDADGVAAVAEQAQAAGFTEAMLRDAGLGPIQAAAVPGPVAPAPVAPPILSVAAVRRTLHAGAIDDRRRLPGSIPHPRPALHDRDRSEKSAWRARAFARSYCCDVGRLY